MMYPFQIEFTNLSDKKLKKKFRKINVSDNTYCFKTIYEKEIFKKYFKKTSFNEISEENINLCFEYYFRIGNNEKESKKILDLILKINPVSIFGLERFMITNFDLLSSNEIKSYIKNMFKYVYNKDDLITIYKILLRYFVKMSEKDKLPVVRYFIKYYYGIVEYNNEMFKKAKNFNIPTGVSSEVIDIIRKMFNDCDDLETKKSILNTLYDAGDYEYSSKYMDELCSRKNLVFKYDSKISDFSFNDIYSKIIIYESADNARKLDEALGYDYDNSNLVVGQVKYHPGLVNVIFNITTAFKDENNKITIHASKLNYLDDENNQFISRLSDIKDFNFMFANDLDLDFEDVLFYNKNKNPFDEMMDDMSFLKSKLLKHTMKNLGINQESEIEFYKKLIKKFKGIADKDDALTIPIDLNGEILKCKDSLEFF